MIGPPTRTDKIFSGLFVFVSVMLLGYGIYFGIFYIKYELWDTIWGNIVFGFISCLFILMLHVSLSLTAYAWDCPRLKRRFKLDYWI
ncbi:TPA: hypothetical protein DF272_06705 [Candidatus Falkowbacteria bacterium]|nr:hypothetical protein [Candidatus Falkowbacteria bacterium]